MVRQRSVFFNVFRDCLNPPCFAGEDVSLLYNTLVFLLAHLYLRVLLKYGSVSTYDNDHRGNRDVREVPYLQCTKAILSEWGAGGGEGLRVMASCLRLPKVTARRV